jgi:hypothetical protein
MVLEFIACKDHQGGKGIGRSGYDEELHLTVRFARRT